MNGTPSGKPDVILIGAGIMSATLAVFLKELDPSLSIEIFEMLDGAALESSDAWNNAGTGHAALCELNYTPERADGRDARTLSEWVPIVMGGRVINQDVAATRMIIGADVNYGALTRNLIAYLQTLSGFAIHLFAPHHASASRCGRLARRSARPDERPLGIDAGQIRLSRRRRRRAAAAAEIGNSGSLRLCRISGERHLAAH
jgi:hypothetical protein